MKNLKSLLSVMLLAGAAQMTLAAPVHAADVDANTGVQTDVDKSKSTDRMSEEATINANSPAVGQEKGQDRAAERKAIDHTNKGKHNAKSKSSTPTGSSDSSQY